MFTPTHPAVRFCRWFRYKKNYETVIRPECFECGSSATLWPTIRIGSNRRRPDVATVNRMQGCRFGRSARSGRLLMIRSLLRPGSWRAQTNECDERPPERPLDSRARVLARVNAHESQGPLWSDARVHLQFDDHLSTTAIKKRTQTHSKQWWESNNGD